MEAQYLGVSSAEAACTRANHARCVAAREVEKIKKQITIAENAHLQNQPSIETDSGYSYYVRERDNAHKAKANAIAEIDRKIEALEAKKEQMIKDYEARAEMHHTNAERQREKLEASKPTSLSYRKLISSLAEAEKIEEDAAKQALEATIALQAACEKRNLQLQRQQEAFERDEKRKEEIKKAEALLAYEARLARENKESLERQRERDRVAAPNPPIVPSINPPTVASKAPVKKGTIDCRKQPLKPKKVYTLEQLDEYDVDILCLDECERQFEIWEDRRALEAYQSRRPGWASSKYCVVKEDTKHTTSIDEPINPDWTALHR